MPAVNRYFGMGRLTKDPDVKYSPKGDCICHFSIAINRVYTTATGEKKERVTFIDCEAFRKQAEVIGEHFKKGKMIFIEGWLENDNWEHNGEKRSRIYCRVDNFQFLEPRDLQADQEKPVEEKNPDGTYKF